MLKLGTSKIVLGFFLLLLTMSSIHLAASRIHILFFHSPLRSPFRSSFLFLGLSLYSSDCNLCMYLLIIKFIGVTLVKRSYRFQVYISVKHDLCIALCAHYPKSNHLLSPYICSPLPCPTPSLWKPT